MITDKESQIDNLQKEIAAKDETIQHQGADIQRQTTEIEELRADIEKKNEEVERCNQEITNQQITINELKAKLPSRELMQVNIGYYYLRILILVKSEI